MAEIQCTEKTQKAYPTLLEHFQKLAFKQADEFIECGQSASEACSLVANILVRVAWVCAGTGVIADGGKPNPDNFRSAVEDALAMYAPKEVDSAE